MTGQVLPWKLESFNRLQVSKIVTLDGFCQCSCFSGGEMNSWCFLRHQLPRILQAVLGSVLVFHLALPLHSSGREGACCCFITASQGPSEVFGTVVKAQLTGLTIPVCSHSLTVALGTGPRDSPGLGCDAQEGERRGLYWVGQCPPHPQFISIWNP